MWTSFWDMSSGGKEKLDWPLIYIEAPEQEARKLFVDLFHRDPNNVTCQCCGPDYSITEYETLDEATEYHRSEYNGRTREVTRTTEEYIKDPAVKVIFKDKLEQG